MASTGGSNPLSLGSNPSGGTKLKCSMIQNILKGLAIEVVNFAECVVNLVEHHNLQNEQWFLDFLDSLNKTSVSH